MLHETETSCFAMKKELFVLEYIYTAKQNKGCTSN